MAAQHIFHATPAGSTVHVEITVPSSTSTSSALTPIIYIHGLGGSTNAFEPLVSSFRDHLQIRVDLPGAARSPLPAHPITVPGWVSDLSHVIDTFVPAITQRIVLVGHSLGAIVAMHFAVANPNRIAGLALLGPGRSATKIPAVVDRFRGMAKTACEQGMAALADSTVANNVAPGSSGAVKAFVREAAMAQSGEGYAACCEALVDPSHVDPDYAAIVAPTVVVAGDQDGICPMERAVGLTELIGGERTKVELVAVKSGHQMHLEDTEAVIRALKTLLEKL